MGGPSCWWGIRWFLSFAHFFILGFGEFLSNLVAGFAPRFTVFWDLEAWVSEPSDVFISVANPADSFVGGWSVRPLVSCIEGWESHGSIFIVVYAKDF